MKISQCYLIAITSEVGGSILETNDSITHKKMTFKNEKGWNTLAIVWRNKDINLLNLKIWDKGDH